MRHDHWNSRHNRRDFLRLTGTTLSAVTVGAGPTASATGDRGRFLIDLEEVSHSDVPSDVEIIHDISEVNLLVAHGTASSVGGAAATVPDVTVYQQTGGPVIEHDGPTVNQKVQNNIHDGPTMNTELQWDKRIQNVDHLIDKPGGGQFIHDTTEGAGTRVAVVDSGVYDVHPDLTSVVNADMSANFTTDSYDFRPHGAGSHGTHVAGTIAATNYNGGPHGGILGTAPETEIIALRVFSGIEGATGDTLAALVDAANKGCDAANISLGYPKPYVYPDKYPKLLDIRDAYRRVATYARKNDMVIVNSAGNSSLDMDGEGVLSLPTEVAGIFGVAATGPIGFGWGDNHDDDNEENWLTSNRLEEPTTQPAFYTNYGDAVDISAAGGNADLDKPEHWKRDLVYSTIYTTDKNGTVRAGYGWKAGTSMAAPQVTGAVALVRSLRPNASAKDVERLIHETANDAPKGTAYHGAGHLNLEHLIKRAEK